MNDTSPVRKKLKPQTNTKTSIDEDCSNPKRFRSDQNPSLGVDQAELQSQKRKNFVKACELVSYKAYFDYNTRLHLIDIPACASEINCRHHDYNNLKKIKEISGCSEESFKIEMKSNMWMEALEVCFMYITTNQCLSADVLKDIIEIMLNAHEEEYNDEYSVSHLINKCQQILSQNFRFHPPCQVKNLRQCYVKFLTTSLDPKQNTFTNRSEFEFDKGIVKYCMNRLEYEISAESIDEALIDKNENIPEEMKESVKGLNWQKEKFEIYELLKRTDRIERLMYVLDSIIELLQFDLAIWQSRYTNNMGSHIMRSHKPLLAFILWQNEVLYTGTVNKICKQFLRLFSYIVHLNYAEEYIKIMATWLNAIVQTFYICETKSNSDYPNIGKYCWVFAKEFYKVMADLPCDSIINIIKRIQPTFMQYLVGCLHIKNLFNTQEDDILKIFINFVKNMQWKLFHEGNDKLAITKINVTKPRKVNDVLNYILKKCSNIRSTPSKPSTSQNSLPKMNDTCSNHCEINQNHVVLSFYITVEAYLDAYSVQNLQDTLEKLNEQLNLGTTLKIEETHTEMRSYSVSESFIKKYRSIYQLLKELILILTQMKNEGKLPDSFAVFENIGLLGL